MSEINTTQDFLSQAGEKPKLPGYLNVLTILTFIGCGVFALFTPASFWLIKFYMKMMDDPAARERMTDKQLTDAEMQRPRMELMLANKWLLILISLAGIALCLYGALQMRKLKKEGFYVYTLGQVLPFICGGLIVGFANQFNGVLSYIVAAVPVAFIIMYATHLKYMK